MIHKMCKSYIAHVIYFSFVAFALSANAQNDTESIEEIIVTGTATARTAFDTPLSVTSFNEEELQRRGSNSQADILRAVPGINAEGGGGEVASNIRITGLPSGGQYAFTPLQYDGVPTISTFGLNSSAHDVYQSNDLGIERLEFVRGGVSNLFGAGSVAGIINYISKTGSDDRENIVQLEIAEEGRQRLDFFTSGATSDNNYYAVSGFYRKDDGPLDSGIPTEGGQLRANFKHAFDDGSGSLIVRTQLIDDKVQFFLPYPLNAGSFTRPNGNDGGEIFTLQTSGAQNLSFQQPNGNTYTTAISNGVSTSGGSIGLEFDKDIGDEFTLNVKAKYSDYDHEFNLFLDGDGTANALPQPVSQLAPGSTFTFADNGQAFSGSSLVFGNRILDRQRPATDLTGEINITKAIGIHNLTAGFYFADAEADDTDFILTYLAEFNNAPRLVSATGVTDAQGLVLGTGIQTSDNTVSSKKTAVYFADQIEADRWNFDVGLRIEKIDADINAPSFSGGVQTGRGNVGSVDDTAVAVAVAGTYRISDSVNFFANVSDGFFFPQPRGVRFNNGVPGPYDQEDIFRLQAGLKFSTDKFQGEASLIKVELDNRQNIQFLDDGMGGVVTISNETASEANAFEFSGSYFISDKLTLSGNVTLQDPEFTRYDGTNNVGNEFGRHPNKAANIGLTYDDGKFDVSLFNTYTGKAFTNDGNTVELDSFNILNLRAGYSMTLANDGRVRFSLGVFNLVDEEGITEGSPRQGSAQNTAGAFFVGRPILPRRTSLRVTYDF